MTIRSVLNPAVSLGVLLAVLGSAPAHADNDHFASVSTIAFASTRDNPTAEPVGNGLEIYLTSVNPHGEFLPPQRLTFNADGEALAALSPSGKQITFDSNRNRVAGEPNNTTDLFVMNTDGTEQTFLTRGSSASWSPDGKNIAFHGSASGTGVPTRSDAGAPYPDSDIFTVNVDDLIAGIEQPTNLTNNGAATIDDDPDWSPDGRTIVFVSRLNPHLQNDPSAEIYAMNADVTGAPTQLTFSNTDAERGEERGPSWSPDGTRIAFSCRRGGSDFEICVMNADGSNQLQLTDNTVPDLTPAWSPDGQQIVFARTLTPGITQLLVINADGTGATQITGPPGVSLLASWGELRVKVDG